MKNLAAIISAITCFVVHVERVEARYGGGMNLYAYVGARPMYAVDPTGLKVHVIARPDHNDDWREVARKKRFYNEILNALQEVVGDCATLSYGNVATIGVGDGSTIVNTEAQIEYVENNADCASKCCWNELKKALDDPGRINIDYQADKNGMNEDWKKGEDPTIYIDPGNPGPGLWEINPGGGGIFAKPTLPIVVWHELMGHAWPAVSTGNPNAHSTRPENFYNQQNAGGSYYDPAIEIENMGRECLRKQGQPVRDRVHQYWGYENGTGLGNWLSNGEWTTWPKPGDTRPY